jgi:hypothetical protein
MTLSDILRDLKPIPSVYLRAARLIEEGNLQELKPVNIAVLSTFTSEVLRPYVIVESAARGILARPYFGPFNQIDQSVLDDASPLYDSKPDVVVLAARTEEIAPNLISRFFTLSSADVNNELARIEEWPTRLLHFWWQVCRMRLWSPLRRRSSSGQISGLQMFAEHSVVLTCSITHG